MPETETNQDSFNYTLDYKIGLPDYSHIRIFASLSRSVEDNEEQRQEVMDTVEQILVTQSEKIKENLGIK